MTQSRRFLLKLQHLTPSGWAERQTQLSLGAGTFLHLSLPWEQELCLLFAEAFCPICGEFLEGVLPKFCGDML